MTNEKTLTQRRRRRKKVASIEDVRGSLAGLLPSLIHDATASYEEYSRTAVPEDAKGFAAHHAACKSALSHIELLTKLARWADKEEEPATATLSEDEEIAALLRNARTALNDIEV